MTYRKLNSAAGFTVGITDVEGASYAGLFRGARGIKFGENRQRDGSVVQDIRYIGDFYSPTKNFTTRGDIQLPEDGLWSAWLPTQLRNIFMNLETKEEIVPRETPIILTYTGTVPTKGGGNDTHIFDVEGGDVGDALDELLPDKAQKPEPVAARGRGRR